MMATPMTPSQRLAAYRAEGIKIVEIPGWRDRCRCHDGSHERGERPTKRPWGPVNGSMDHHTGSNTSAATDDRYAGGFLVTGSNELPGPLCHDSIGADGTLFLVASGRANHAGGGDAAVLAAVRSESDWLATREAKPTVGNKGGVDGNAHFYGVEVQYSGAAAPNAAQIDTMIRRDAAIARFHGWSARSIIGHREWSRDKWDPGHYDMVAHRRAVQARLNTATGGSGPLPLSPEEDDMPYTPQELRTMMREEAWNALNARMWQPLHADSTDPIVKSTLTNNLIYMSLHTQMIPAIAAKLDIDVDEAALAKALAETLIPVVRESLLESGVAEATADAVVAKLGSKLA